MTMPPQHEQVGTTTSSGFSFLDMDAAVIYEQALRMEAENKARENIFIDVVDLPHLRWLVVAHASIGHYAQKARPLDAPQIADTVTVIVEGLNVCAQHAFQTYVLRFDSAGILLPSSSFSNRSTADETACVSSDASWPDVDGSLVLEDRGIVFGQVPIEESDVITARAVLEQIHDYSV